MTFVHDAPDFPELVRIAAQARGLALGLVEKDYWVTHVLWALQAQGLEVWFKGGTSLSKGFGLVERFSEDLDLKVEPGTVKAIPRVKSWKSEGSRATASRLSYFEALETALVLPGMAATLDREQADRSHRSGVFQARYPGAFLDDLAGIMRPFVLLEVGSARVRPFVRRDISSFVHDQLAETGVRAEFRDNRPVGLRCLHPLVTLLEKLDAVSRRFPRAERDAAAFVRHYEDAAHIVRNLDELPPLDATPSEIAVEMVRQRQLRRMPSAKDPAFSAGSGASWSAVGRAHAEISPMFWGGRLGLGEACADIRHWIDTQLP